MKQNPMVLGRELYVKMGYQRFLACILAPLIILFLLLHCKCIILLI